jgi:hypothetical protein
VFGAANIARAGGRQNRRGLAEQRFRGLPIRR